METVNSSALGPWPEWEGQDLVYRAHLVVGMTVFLTGM